MGTITNANPSDAAKLCEIAVSAFMEDERHKPDHVPPGGPPDHDKIQSHLNWIRRNIYLKYEENERLRGGCVARVNGSHGEITGIFVEASAMNRDIGSALLKHLTGNNPEVTTWTLETPDYAKRNHAFYEKHGFVCVRRTAPEAGPGFGFYRFQKKVSPTARRPIT